MRNEIFMRFVGGREKALTLSYDDGVRQDKRLMSILDNYGIKCTFNLNSGICGSDAEDRMPYDETVSVYKNCGHEIAAHGFKHLYITKVDTMRVIDEVISDKKELEKIYERVVCGFAYPYGVFSDSIVNALELMNIKYARTTISTHSFDVPTDFLRLNPTCHHADGMLEELTDKFLDTYPHDSVKFRDPYLFYLWGHSYEFDRQNNWHIIENFAKKVGNNNDIYYATNGEIYRYVTAFRNLEFSVNADYVYNPSAIDVWFEKSKKIFIAKAGKTTYCPD